MLPCVEKGGILLFYCGAIILSGEAIFRGNVRYLWCWDRMIISMGNILKIRFKDMKRQLLTLMAAVVVVCCQAQEAAGRFSVVPKVGVNIANISNFKWTGEETLKPASSKMKAGMTVGAEAEYQATQTLAVGAGLLYSMQGVGYDDFVVPLGRNIFQGVKDFRLNLQYLNVPVFVRQYLFKGFSIMAGVQPGILLDARVKSNESVWTVSDDNKAVYESQHDVDDKWHGVRDFYVSIPVGVAYEYERVLIEARYNFGVTKVFEYNLFNSRNGVMTFTVGYRI